MRRLATGDRAVSRPRMRSLTSSSGMGGFPGRSSFARSQALVSGLAVRSRLRGAAPASGLRLIGLPVYCHLVRPLAMCRRPASRRAVGRSLAMCRRPASRRAVGRSLASGLLVSRRAVSRRAVSRRAVSRRAVSGPSVSRRLTSRRAVTGMQHARDGTATTHGSGRGTCRPRRSAHRTRRRREHQQHSGHSQTSEDGDPPRSPTTGLQLHQRFLHAYVTRTGCSAQVPTRTGRSSGRAPAGPSKRSRVYPDSGRCISRVKD